MNIESCDVITDKKKNNSLYQLKKYIMEMTTLQQMEVYKILERNNAKYTINTNGVFFNLGNQSNELIKKLQDYNKFRIETKIDRSNLMDSSNLMDRANLKN